MKYALFLISFCILGPVFVQAQSASSEFTLRLLVGADTTPPTTPQNLTATPVSQSEIDLTWNASTDNFSFGGYQVYRDSAQIATTTLTTYSDTGLATSTLYTYEIVAFDSALNYSSSSIAVATTTLAAPATTTPTTTDNTGQSKGTIEPVETQIDNFLIETTQTSAHITFDTNVSVRAVYRWGRTLEYELGLIASDSYRREHSTVIDGLSPGTVYELEIVLERRLTGETITKRVQFTTLEAPDQTAPPNVMNLSAVWTENGVELSWNNPPVDDFSHVRIVGSDVWYPADPQNGWFVYQGSGEEFFDGDLLEQDWRFYSVFAYDEDGNRSSGASVVVSAPGSSIEDVLDPGSDIVDTPLYRKFSYDDLVAIQNGETLTNFQGALAVTREYETTFQLPYEVLPEHLKTIVLTLRYDKNDTEFSFLLSVNKDKTAYEATIGVLPHVGSYEAVISVYDYRSRNIVVRRGEVLVTERSVTTPVERIETILRINWPLIAALFILTAGVGWLQQRRRQKAKRGKLGFEREPGSVSLSEQE